MQQLELVKEAKISGILEGSLDPRLEASGVLAKDGDGDLVVRLGVTSPPWSREAAGSDWADREEEVTNGRSGLTRPA